MLLLAVLAVVAVALIGVQVAFLASVQIRRFDEPRPGELPTGEEIIRQIARDHQIGKLVVQDGEVDGYLSRERTIELAGGRRERASTSAVAIAAHEGAHLLQHATAYRPWRIWWALGFPALIAYVVAIVLMVPMFFLQSSGIAVAIVVLVAFVAFAGVVSALVESDAKERALSELRRQELPVEELKAVRKVLRAAAAGYVAETIFDVGYLRRQWGSEAIGNSPTGP